MRGNSLELVQEADALTLKEAHVAEKVELVQSGCTHTRIGGEPAVRLVLLLASLQQIKIMSGLGITGLLSILWEEMNVLSLRLSEC